MEQQLKKIRLVTERYRELQGLRLVLLGLALISCFGSYAWLRAPGGTAGFAIAAVMMIAVSFPGLWLADRYYERRFGRVVQVERDNGTTWRVIAFSAASSLLNNWLGVGPAAFMLTVIGPLAFWVGIRDWPIRAYHLAIGIVCVFAFAFVLATRPDVRSVSEAWAMVAIGIVCIPVGLLDHRLLASVMSHTDAQCAAASRE